MNSIGEFMDDWMRMKRENYEHPTVWVLMGAIVLFFVVRWWWKRRHGRLLKAEYERGLAKGRKISESQERKEAEKKA